MAGSCIKRAMAVFLLGVLLAACGPGQPRGISATPTGGAGSRIAVPSAADPSTAAPAATPPAASPAGASPAGASPAAPTPGPASTLPAAAVPALGGPAPTGPVRVVVAGAAGAQFTLAGPGQGPVQHVAPGVLMPVDLVQAGWARVQTPCERSGWVRLADSTTYSQVTVVLDPGHGGAELGAVGVQGLTEKELNLDIANRVAGLLRARGITAILDRSGDYMATLAFRVSAAAALHPTLMLSIHHNAAPDGPSAGPGTETFYQFVSPSSKRLAGLVYEEVTKAIGGLPAAWVANTDKGARWRLNDAGGDYYGILRLADARALTAGLAELMFISNPSEEVLLRRDDVRNTEAAALTQAIVRYLTTQDQGSGFSSPHPRQAPAGGGGGTAGCVDPITP